MQPCSRQPAGHGPALHADATLTRSCMRCRAERMCYAVAHGGQIVVPFSVAQAFVQYCVPERPQMREETLLRNVSEQRGQAAAAAASDGLEVPNSPQPSMLSQRSPGVLGWQADQPGIELTKFVPGRASQGESCPCLAGGIPLAAECGWACV